MSRESRELKEHKPYMYRCNRMHANVHTKKICTLAATNPRSLGFYKEPNL